MLIGIVLWVVLGLVAGFVADKIITERGRVVPRDIVLGISGALIGGWVFNGYEPVGPSGFNTWSLLAATFAAALVLVVVSAVRHTPVRA